MGYSWTLLQDLSEGNSFSFSTRSLWVYEQVRSRNEVRGFHSLVSLIFSLFFSNSCFWLQVFPVVQISNNLVGCLELIRQSGNHS